MNDLQEAGFVKLAGWSQKLRILLIIECALVFVSLFFGIVEIAQFVSFDQPLEYQDLMAHVFIITGVSVVIRISTIVFYCIWLHRAASNIVQSAVEGFDYTPGWVIGWYFIPFANLFKPFQAMRKIWDASHGVGTNAGAGAGTLILTVWWAAWVISYIETMIITAGDIALILEATTFQMRIDWALLSTVSGVASLVFYLATIKLVQDITQAQKAWLDQPNTAEIFS